MCWIMRLVQKQRKIVTIIVLENCLSAVAALYCDLCVRVFVCFFRLKFRAWCRLIMSNFYRVFYFFLLLPPFFRSILFSLLICLNFTVLPLVRVHQRDSSWFILFGCVSSADRSINPCGFLSTKVECEELSLLLLFFF